MAFAGNDVVRVTLPHSLDAIGHKAFYECKKLVTVVFKSYEAPILEEEFDTSSYESFENLPATGEYEFTDYEGNVIKHSGLGNVPFYVNIRWLKENHFYPFNIGLQSYGINVLPTSAFAE